MGIFFKLFLAYDNRFGMLPKLIKSLQASGKPEDLKAAASLQATLDEGKRNPPKTMDELTRKAFSGIDQTGRDLRLEGRHKEAEELAEIVDYTKKNMRSPSARKPKPKR